MSNRNGRERKFIEALKWATTSVGIEKYGEHDREGDKGVDTAWTRMTQGKRWGKGKGKEKEKTLTLLRLLFHVQVNQLKHKTCWYPEVLWGGSLRWSDNHQQCPG